MSQDLQMPTAEELAHLSDAQLFDRLMLLLQSVTEDAIHKRNTEHKKRIFRAYQAERLKRLALAKIKKN